jgi:hypothetical protein
MSRRAFVPLVCLLLLSPLVRAGEATYQVEDVLPSDCYLKLSFAGFRNAAREAESLGLMGLWKEPEVQAFLKGPLGMARMGIGRMPKDGGLPIQDLIDAFGGRVTIAASGITAIGWMIPSPDVLIAIDTAQGGESFQRLFDRGLQEVERHGKPERSAFQFEGQEIQRLRIPGAIHVEGNKLDLNVCWTQLGNLFLLGIDRYFIQRAISCARGNGETPLSKNAAFQRARKKAGGDGTVSCYLNVEGFKARLGPLWPPQWSELASLFGVDGINSLYISSRVDGPASRGVIYLDAPGGQRRGLTKLLSLGAGKAGSPKTVPEGALFYATCNIAPGEAAKEVLSIVEKLHPQSKQHLERHLAQAREEVGFDPLNDLAASLQGDVTLYASVGAGKIFPDVVASLELKDPERFQKCIDALTSMRGGPDIRSAPYKGHQLRYFSVPMEGVTLTPAFLVDGNRFLIAVTTGMLKKALDPGIAEGGGLAAHPTFAETRARFPGQPTGFLFVDLKRLVATLYDTALPVLQSMPEMKKAGLDAAMLPTPDVIEKHMGPLAVAYTADQDGFLFDMSSPVGLGAVISLACRAAAEQDFHLTGNMMGVRRSAVGAPRRSSSAPARRHAEPPQPIRRNAAQRGDALFQEEKWEEALSAYREALAASPEDAKVQFRVALCQHNLGRWREAIPGFERAAELGFDGPGVCYYNIACGDALLGEKDQAFAWLKRAVKAGFRNRDLMASDEDLKSLRDDPRFKQVLDSIPSDE